MNNDLLMKYVRHLETGRIGRMIQVYGPGEYKDENDNALPEAIAALDNGDKFIWHEDRQVFEELTAIEVQFFSVTRQAVVKTVQELGVWAAGHGMDIHKAADAIIQTLTEQAVALRNVPEDKVPEGFAAVEASRISHCSACPQTFLDAPPNARCPKCKGELSSGPLPS